MRLAYLCNLYPAISHSFVRREIEAVEDAGCVVHRFSLRPAQKLADEVDVQEAKQTEIVLARGALRLLAAAMILLVTRPAKTVRAVIVTYRLSSTGLKRKLRHVAYFLEAAWLARRLGELRVDHLHAHFGTNPAAVARICRALGGPSYSFTVHGPDEFDAPIELSLREKIAGAAFVVAITNYCRSQLMRWSAPSDWEKIRVIRCGIDDEFIEAQVQPVPDGSIDLVCIGRLAPQKGLPLLIEACDRLNRRGEKFRLTIIGDGEMRGDLEASIARRDLEERVTLAGNCSWAELRDHLLKSRAFVLPSFAEGLPMVIMEALALSRPVVTTAIAGIPELVDDDCGWMVPAGSVDALVEAMKQALHASAEELARKAAVGRERVRRLHDRRTTAEQILGEIRSRGDARFPHPVNQELSAA